jgi:hypothetical protein
MGGGYFVADGIEAGLNTETRFGNEPRITQKGPLIRIMVNTADALIPYAGIVPRRTFIENHQDSDSIGARVALFYAAGQNAFFGAGVIHETHLSFDRTVYSSCSKTYPELSIAFLFG